MWKNQEASVYPCYFKKDKYIPKYLGGTVDSGRLEWHRE